MENLYENNKITKYQWKTFISAYVGWMLDIMDLMLFAMLISAISADLGFNASMAGTIASMTLLATAIGGLLFGFIADRLGRVTSMVLSILCYSIGTGLCAFSTSFWMLLIFRFIVGLGVGGEWSAGAALVSETWPAKMRGKILGWVQSAFAAGYALAAVVVAIVTPIAGWRWAFAFGIIPALLAFFIRKNTKESPIWEERSNNKKIGLFEAINKLINNHRKETIICFCFTSMAMCGYWGLFTWIPSYLSTSQSSGGAGLSLIKSTTWIVIMQIFATIGFISFGYVSDVIGRKISFIICFVAVSILIPFFASVKEPNYLVIIGSLVAYFGSAFYSGFAPTFAELFPTSIRATAQGIIYNGSRAMSAIAPALVGFFADHYGISTSILLTSGFFIIAAFIVMVFLPETKSAELV